MKIKKWLGSAVAVAMLSTSLLAMPSEAAKKEDEQPRTIQDESIYDLLIDRYFNQLKSNDFEVDSTNPESFAGGDFVGLQNKFNYVYDMGFSMLSIGAIFSTEKYDGSMPTSHTTLERHFGTQEELDELIKAYKKYDITIMADFPLSQASKNHEWANNQDWILSEENGVIQWDLTNKDVQKALQEAAVAFVKQNDFAGLRLTYLGNAPTDFQNDLMQAIKKEKDIYVIANGESEADYDATFSLETADIYRGAFRNVNESMEKLPQTVEGDKPSQLMIDRFDTSRFTFDSEETNMYPITRIRMALGALLTLPGVPVIQYGTEIAMNGEKEPYTHGIMNFSVDDELQKSIRNTLQLRNESPTLRHGDAKLIKSEDGLLVFTKESEDEKWVIFVNNTDKTQTVEFTTEELGEGKELKGLFERDLVREKDGVYRLVLNREIVEVYQVIDDEGFNVPYAVALSIVYIAFISFVVIVIRRSKRNKVK
ncbi:alpha-amylase [Lysinibacillus alkalisoli]|uniref:Alpha-amylase n=1 Tax=Lysinibacillus alkalisoli TaxID=1911548 RepID=A0A917D5H2_9BACI|nr:alpha-amylase family glycosyl hydrolase [Lysinibacillus alkalisoli]GGG13539.1 alpha-amylase [Lysinibacillus alkalisoli]